MHNYSGVNNPNYRHGLALTKPYWVWADMKGRCTNPNHKKYADYGGRGITLCDRWQTFAVFWEDMGSTYQPNLTINRTNNDGGYSPDNCEWVTNRENVRNKRNNIWVETPQGRMLGVDAARLYNIPHQTLYSRVRRGADPLAKRK